MESRQSIYHMLVLHHMKIRKLLMQSLFRTLSTNPGDLSQYAQNKIIQQAVDKYFKLKAKRAKEEILYSSQATNHTGS